MTIIWGDHKIQDGRFYNQCRACFYCLKVVKSQYRPKYTFKGVGVLIGRDSEEHKKFFDLRNRVIEIIKSTKDPLCRINWTKEKKELQHVVDNTHQWEAPKILFYPYDQYEKDFGWPPEREMGIKEERIQ